MLKLPLKPGHWTAVFFLLGHVSIALSPFCLAYMSKLTYTFLISALTFLEKGYLENESGPEVCSVGCCCSQA